MEKHLHSEVRIEISLPLGGLVTRRRRGEGFGVGLCSVPVLPAGYLGVFTW